MGPDCRDAAGGREGGGMTEAELEVRAGAHVVALGRAGGCARERRDVRAGAQVGALGRAPGPSNRTSPNKSYGGSPIKSLHIPSPPLEAVVSEREVVTAVLQGARRRSSERFIKGPIPVSTIAVAGRLPSKFAVPVLLAVRHCTDVAGKPWVVLSAKTASAFGFDRHAKDRALRELEGAGLIRVKRVPGRPASVSLTGKRTGGDDAA